MRIEPGIAPRLHFFVLDEDGVPDATLVYTEVTTAKYRTRTAGVASADSTAITLAAGSFTDAHATGTFGLVNAALGEYFVDCPVGAALSTADTVELRIVLTDGTLVLIPVVAEIDVKSSAIQETLLSVKSKTDLITSQTAPQTTSPVNTLTVNRGDSFVGTHPVTTNYTGYTATFTVRHRVTDAVLCTASAAVTSSTLLTVTLATTDTAFALLVSADEFGPHPYDIQLVSGSTQKTERGIMVITQDQTRA